MIFTLISEVISGKFWGYEHIDARSCLNALAPTHFVAATKINAIMDEKITKTAVASYSQFACVGTGLSAIALGATLKRWYQMDDIRFFERCSDCGETWHISSYPGLYLFPIELGLLLISFRLRL